MKEINLKYLCKMMGDMAGMPIRIYEKKTMNFYHCVINIPVDPISLYLNDIWQITDTIGYFVTEHFDYYGILNSDTTKIVIGPTRLTERTNQELRELAFRLDITDEDITDFMLGMKSIVYMPLESILQMLCTLNYVINDEMLDLKDITAYDARNIEITEYCSLGDIKPADITNMHNTYFIEQKLLSMIQQGNIQALEQYLTVLPGMRSGILSKNQLRQDKNLFIVTASLVSRAAIQGGMDIEDAFSLSDAFIQRCELLNYPSQIRNLQYHMLLDFADRMHHIRYGDNPSALVLKVTNYIEHHLSEQITAEMLAKELYLSRPYLSMKFKKETGISLTDFIQNEKIEEAKKILHYSSKSLTAISSYLGFSSPSHFTRVFKKCTGQTPHDYRMSQTFPSS